MHRFFTPLLRRLYIFLGAFLVFYFVATMVQHSSWNKERLYRKLLLGTRPEKMSATVELVYLKAQRQLIRALKSPSGEVRKMAGDALWEVWFHAAGEEAFRLTVAAGNLMEQRAFPEALKMLTELTVSYPTFAEGWNRRATLFWQIGRYEESIADCWRVVSLNPSHFGAWQGMGLCQLHVGDVDGACRSLQRALQINPHDRGLRQFRQHCEELRERFSPRRKPDLELIQNSTRSDSFDFAAAALFSHVTTAYGLRITFCGSRFTFHASRLTFL